MKPNYKCGVQFDTEVVATKFGSSILPEEALENKILVTQVYQSAISVSYSDCSTGNWSIFSSFV